MRSYERQGLDIIPTVHMGAAVSALERKGIQTNIGNLNRDIKAANRMMNAIRSTIKGLRDWIADIVSATREALLCKKTSCRKAKKIKQVKILWKKQRPTVSKVGRSS